MTNTRKLKLEIKELDIALTDIAPTPKVFEEYLVIVVRQDGFVHKQMVSESNVKTLKTFSYNDHRYEFVTDDAFQLRGYLQPDWRSPIAMLEWIDIWRVKRGCLIYREPADLSNWDYADSVEIPNLPVKPDMTPELLASQIVRGSNIDPRVFSTLASSNIYRRRVSKVKFGTPNLYLILVAGGVIAAGLLLMMAMGLP